MKLHSALATAAAGILSLALVAPATAAVDVASAITQPTIAPAGPGDNGKPEDTGKPAEPGNPDQPGVTSHGAPDDVGPNREPPLLPDNASPRAHAAVEAAYEHFAAISGRIAAIRALEPGRDRNEALNAVFVEFGDMLHTVSDAVQGTDPHDGADDPDPGDAEITLNGNGNGNGNGNDDDEDPDEDDDDDDDQDDEETDDEE